LVQPIEWDEKQERAHTSVLNENQLQKARTNAEEMVVYRIQYRVQGRVVTGYIVAPLADETDKHPVVIWNRGGTMDVGVVKLGQIFLEPTITELAKKGYFVILSQYSGQDGGEGKDEMGGEDLNDILALKTIAQEVEQIDESRIGMYGISRGGLMTYLALATTNWVKAAITVGGRANVKQAAQERPEMKERFKQMFEVSEDAYTRRSAVCWPDQFSNNTPLLMMHGTADWRVNPLNSVDLSRGLLKYQKPHRLILFEGADHTITEHRDEMLSQLISWFDRFLKNKESLPDIVPHGK